MKRIRQNTYVERELRRRRIEKHQMVIDNVSNVLASIALVFVTEVFMFALFLM